MAIVKPIKDLTAFRAWVESRPGPVQKMIASHPPDRLYQMKSTGQRCTLYSYAENGTVTVEITGEFNFVAFSRSVFGIDLNDLVECNLPPKDEVVGDVAEEAGLTQDDIMREMSSLPANLSPDDRRKHLLNFIANKSESPNAK